MSTTDIAPSDEERHSVSELVRNFGESLTESHGKRDRSESGDSAPAGKRGARERDSPEPSPTPRSSNLKSYLDTALEKLENRITSSISKDLHEFRELISSELGALSDRVRDLERHVEERDNEVVALTRDLETARKDITILQERTENAEMNSRIPCLILSGRAMMPRRSPGLDAPLRPTHSSAPRGVTLTATGAAGPAGADRSPVGARERPPVGRPADGGAEDVNGLVISAVQSRLPGLRITEHDIDRAHRLPGPNNRVIVRFVHSGPGSVRDQLMTRRLELKGQDLYINESLTAHKSQIFRSLLEAKKSKTIYTVYTRWGHVFFKSEKFGTSTRVDSIDKLRELSIPVKQ